MLETAYFKSTIGWLEIKGSELGIKSVRKTDLSFSEVPEVPEPLRDCVQQLAEYFDGNRENFDLKYDWGGEADFNVSVWKALLEIPYGRTTSYSAIAEKIGNPKAVRAVGMANRNNRIAIIVPCHRVIAKSGNLHGYFYGLDVKRKLLEIENPMSFAQQGELF